MTTIAFPGAGAQLDALIDEKVFGYTWQPITPEDIAPRTCTHRLYKHPGGVGHIRAERHADGRVVALGGRDYSDEIGKAMLIVALFVSRGQYVTMNNFWVGARVMWTVSIEDSAGEWAAEAEALTVAICWAAIDAAEAQVGVHSGPARTTDVPDSERPATECGTRGETEPHSGAKT